MNLKQKPGFIITEVVINLKGNFTAEEIFLSLKEKNEKYVPKRKRYEKLHKEKTWNLMRTWFNRQNKFLLFLKIKRA